MREKTYHRGCRLGGGNYPRLGRLPAQVYIRFGSFTTDAVGATRSFMSALASESGQTAEVLAMSLCARSGLVYRNRKKHPYSITSPANTDDCRYAGCCTHASSLRYAWQEAL